MLFPSRAESTSVFAVLHDTLKSNLPKWKSVYHTEVQLALSNGRTSVAERKNVYRKFPLSVNIIKVSTVHHDPAKHLTQHCKQD